VIARLIPDTSQLRFYAQSALNGFDTLDPEDAAENAKADLRSLLAYIGALDGADAVPILGIAQIEARVASEFRGCEGH